MPISIVTPQMGESIVEGTIGKWVKNVGDKVERDETIVEILTDKVTVEVPSGYSGTMGKILAKQDEVVQVGQVLAILLREGEDASDGERCYLADAQNPRRQMPPRRTRILRIVLPINQPIKRHRRTTGSNHTKQDAQQKLMFHTYLNSN